MSVLPPGNHCMTHPFQFISVNLLLFSTPPMFGSRSRTCTATLNQCPDDGRLLGRERA